VTRHPPTWVIGFLAVLVLTAIAVRAQDRVPMAAPFVPPPAPAQPVPFSHKRHAAIGFECRQCHANPDGGRMMTFPPSEICLSCHQTIAADRPSIQKLTALAAAGPVPWVRVYTLPEYVFWNHGSHLKAGVACQACHGAVAERDVTAQETDVVTMLGCQRCHDQRRAPTDCGDCHEPRR
jgi:Cytochrome c7 and related cytochrome c/Class III cytochrome C family